MTRGYIYNNDRVIGNGWRPLLCESPHSFQVCLSSAIAAGIISYYISKAGALIHQALKTFTFHR